MRILSLPSIVRSGNETRQDDGTSLLCAAVLLGVMLILLAFGLMMVYSTTVAKSGDTMFFKQLMWGGIGLGCAIGLILLGPKRLTDWRLVSFLLLIAWALLLYARFVGRPINGAYRWIQFGGISIQPSEIAKFVCIVLFARWAFDHLRELPRLASELWTQTCRMLHRENESFWGRPLLFFGGFLLIAAAAGVTAVKSLDVARFAIAGVMMIPGLVCLGIAMRSTRDYNSWRYISLVLPPACLAVSLGLIFLGKDLGMTLLTGASAGAILFVAGLALRWVFLSLGTVTAAVLYLCSDPDSFRYKRIFSFLDPENTGAAGFQIWMSLLALGSGGLYGRGLGEGRLKTGYLPEDHTDCILSIAGEELGMIALFFLIALFIVMLAMGVLISVRANNKCSMFLGAGFTTMLGIQMLINIAVITSSMPAKGMPAPFISYGGSNMVISMMAIGVLCAIAVESAFPNFHDALFDGIKRLLPGKR